MCYAILHTLLEGRLPLVCVMFLQEPCPTGPLERISTEWTHVMYTVRCFRGVYADFGDGLARKHTSREKK